MKEIWKDIKGYEGLYEVSNYGKVKSLDRFLPHTSGGERLHKGRVLKQLKSPYFSVYISNEFNVKKRYYVHKLVAIAFLNHKPNGFKGLIVDHIDNNPFNNYVDNLQLITQRENVSKSRKIRTSKYIGVSYYKTRNNWVARIDVNGKTKHLGYYKTELEAYNKYQLELKKI